MRCYRKRWRVERLFAWLQHVRRLVIRWENRVENFFGMVRLGCMQILLRYLRDQFYCLEHVVATLPCTAEAVMTDRIAFS